LGNEQSLQRPRAFLPGGRALGVFLPKSLAKEPDKGRSISGFVAAFIYLACKERMIPRTIDEVSRVAGVDKPFAKHCYKILVGEMHIEPPLPILSGT
jgi:transcription initiation factor TFIIIB Brf1 subunit/transcription initiation factor TFIIB